MSEKCSINVFDDGPLGVEDLASLTNSDGETLEIRKKIALCRCGASSNKPFCDGTHKKIGFSSEIPKSENEKENGYGRRAIHACMNGPYEISGDIVLNIKDEMGLSNDDPYYLCRCGASENKPFCDGSHKKINFSD